MEQARLAGTFTSADNASSQQPATPGELLDANLMPLIGRRKRSNQPDRSRLPSARTVRARPCFAPATAEICPHHMHGLAIAPG